MMTDPEIAPDAPGTDLADLCATPAWRCAVHGGTCCGGPCRHEVPPGEDELVAELVAHLTECEDVMCSYCHEEWEVRRQPLGIEDVNLYEDHCLREIEESCTCRHHPRLARAVARYQVGGRGVCPVCDGDEGRHLLGCPFRDHYLTRPGPWEA